MKGFFYHQLYAAVCCAEINKIDSAFSILERISFNQWFDDYEALLTESRFEKLKKDKRWLPVLEKIKKN